MFPLVDEETSAILRFVMDEAKDYNDFAERLCKKAINEPLSELAIYFADYCYIQDEYNLLKHLIDANIKTELTQVFSLVATQRRGVVEAVIPTLFVT
jgi:hypothetical protein